MASLSGFILETKNVHYLYPVGVKALNGLNMAIKKGSKTAVLGANGAGKTTAFLHFNGILKPSSGKVFFNGEKIRYNHSSLMALRKEVGIVFQDPDAQLFSASVQQEVSFGPLNLDLPREEVRLRVAEALSATQTTHLKTRPTHFLSHGQKKRVCIADVLAMRPRVLICDEPTAYLDPELGRRIMDLFDRLAQRGMTVIISTHDVDLAYSWAEKVFILKDGRTVAEGSPEEVLRDEVLLKDVGLAKPWIVDVYEELVDKGVLPSSTVVPKTKAGLFSELARNSTRKNL